MSNKLISFLDAIGQDFEHGLQKLLPFIEKGVAIAQVAEPYIDSINPLFGSVFQTVVTTVSEVEQKFAALGKQSATGIAKLAEATTILTPLLTEHLSTNNAAAIQKYISAVVGVLNSIPAAVATAVPPAAS